MFSEDEIEKVKQLLAGLGKFNFNQDFDQQERHSQQNNQSDNGKNFKSKQSNAGQGKEDTGCIKLLPSELLVIAGIICDVLQVESVLVSRNQTIEIVLTGSLKRKTQLDRIMQQIGKMPFDQVISSIMNNCSDDR
ncbi:MAG TPA: hypothetical protein DDW65_04140 [Firmicutes bacterium]|nr:hypothetical protein [Bacillota bacterium]